MYYKIENKYFWGIVCKQNDNIHLFLDIMIETLNRFIIKNYQEVSTFVESNCIVKYNRIFLKCSEEKLFTFNFPFEIVEGGVLFDGEIIDVHITKAVKRLLTIIEKSSSYEEFLIEYDSIDESEGFKVEEIQLASKILKKIFEMEVGYLRYDKDEEASERHGEEYHPMYHLDIFFDNDVSLKIGIDKRLFVFNRDMETYLDRLFDNSTKKFFLK